MKIRVAGNVMRERQLNKPLVSILLPTHNRADVLPFAIKSVLAQTVQDFELFIVGDGCTDNTAEIVKSFTDARIQWFDLPKAPNFGYANRNIAIKSARGSFIAFMAHDDLWLSDHLEILLKAFEDETVEIAYTRPLWVVPQGIIVPGTFNLNFYPMLEKFLNKERNEIPASCFMHQKECFHKYGYWNENLTVAGDLDLWARIIQAGESKNFAYIENPTCLHFKANWHGKWYEISYGLRFWKALFAREKFLSAQLAIFIPDSITEQEALWNVMSLNPDDWNKKIRSAISQVLDFLANNITMNEHKSIKAVASWLFPKRLINNSFFQYWDKKIKKRPH